MNLNWKMNQETNCLTIELEGRIDSTNVAEAEAAIFELHNQNEGANIVFDAQKLEYISSAGLRVLLKVRKMQDELLIQNVSVEINEIFEITGFSEIMKVEKALRELSIEGAEVIGQGGHGKVLRINGDTIVKLFHPATTLEEVKREQEYAKKAFVLGLPTAIPFDVVKCDGCYGLVFELINSTTLSDFLNKNPERFEEFAVKYANLLKQLHATKVSEDML